MSTDHDFNVMQRVLTQMTEDPQGQDLLDRLNLDGFNMEKEELFDSIAEMTSDPAGTIARISHL